MIRISVIFIYIVSTIPFCRNNDLNNTNMECHCKNSYWTSVCNFFIIIYWPKSGNLNIFYILMWNACKMLFYPPVPKNIPASENIYIFNIHRLDFKVKNSAHLQYIHVTRWFRFNNFYWFLPLFKYSLFNYLNYLFRSR